MSARSLWLVILLITAVDAKAADLPRAVDEPPVPSAMKQTSRPTAAEQLMSPIEPGVVKRRSRVATRDPWALGIGLGVMSIIGVRQPERPRPLTGALPPPSPLAPADKVDPQSR